MTKIIQVVLCGITLMTASAASAENTVRVPTQDIDPADDRDIARLQRRLAASVEKVCGSYAGASSSEEYEIKACRQEALAGIRRQLVASLPNAALRLARR